MKLKSGHEVMNPSDGKQKELRDLFRAYSEGMIRLQPGRWLYTKPFQNVADKIYDFKFKASDVVIMTYPKSGTTWMQEILWTMMKNINLDNEETKYPVFLRCPFIEGDFLMATPNIPPPEPDSPAIEYFKKYCPDLNPADGLYVQLTNCAPEPRIIKTHLPFSLHSPAMLDTCKVIFVVRNPKDVCVSFYHESRIIKTQSYLGDFNTFLNLFVNDKIIYGPMWEFLKEGWERRSHPNFHLVFYEDLKANNYREISRLDKFLGTGLTEEQIQRVMQQSSFQSMKERDVFTSAPGDTQTALIEKDKGEFFRKGEAGDWKKELTKAQEKIMDKWIEENSKRVPIKFTYS